MAEKFNDTGEVGGLPEANLLDTSSDIFSLEQMKDSIALGLVNSQYERYRIWRYRNHDLRWNTDDALYVGWMPQRFWEGSRTARSSLGVPITFDQCESAAPVIMNALFGDVEWFECDPLGDATPDDARQQKERLMYLLENPRNKIGNTARNELRLAVKQLLVYGNGAVNVEHDGETGDPIVEWKDIRDIYIDPGCSTPLIDDSQSVVDRDFLTLDELESLRGAPGIKLPPQDVLRRMADQRPADTADLTKQNQEAYRNVIYRPGYDDSTDFGPNKKLEVLRYQDEARIIWVIQRRWVMYNELNPYGFITYCAAPCYVMPGRFYGMGIADALEGNQKYAQAILNGHLDELSLTLNPPRARSRSATMTQGSSQLRPGQVWEMDKPKDDMIMYPPAGATNQGWQEIQFLEASSERRTGVTNMISQGMPIKSNASRTATGIQAQTAGPTTRLQAIVEHIEDYLIVPMLYKMIAMDAKHASAGDSSLQGMSAQGGFTQVAKSSLKAPVKFRIKASSRMLTQSKLQFIAPFLSQYLMNGAFMSQLAKSGQTVDFNSFFDLIQDATGTRAAYRLIRPLNDQEKQQMSSPPPEAVMKDKMADKQIASREKIAQIDAEAKKEAASAMATKGDEEQALKLLELFLQNEQQVGLAPGGSMPLASGQPAPGVQGMLGGPPAPSQGTPGA